MLLGLFALVACTSAWPLMDTKEEISNGIEETTSNRVTDYFEMKVNEVAGVSCEVCLKAVYGINYNVIRLKKAAEDAVKLDCEALFHGNAKYIAQCIRVMIEKIEHIYDRVEPVIDTRNLCVKMRMCSPDVAKKD